MASRHGPGEDPVRILEQLMAMEYDAEEAYQAAIDHLADRRFRGPLIEFKAHHERRLRDLAPLIWRLGGTPPSGPDVQGRLEEGKVWFAQLGGDESILKSMRKNADHAREAYDRALARAPEEARDVLRRGRDDESRHRDWIDEQIHKLESAPHRGAPPWNIPPPSGL